MQHPQTSLSSPQLGQFYALNKQDVRLFDAAQPEGVKYFTALQPGGNAYLLDYDAFDPLLHEDLDPGDAELGCSIQLDVVMTQEQRLQLCSGLIALGYAVSLYRDHLLLVPWHREMITKVVVRDIHQIVSDLSGKSLQDPLFRLSSEQMLVWLDDADRSIALAQEFFTPLEKHSLETEIDSQPTSLLHGAALQLQAARRFLEEGRGILEMLPRLNVHLLSPHITATCYSDDHVIEVSTFDATLWFAQASDDAIRALQSEAYGGDETADSVAELAADYDERVQAMFDHNHALAVSTELRGFECHVDEMEAEAWLAVHRPHLVQEEKA